MSTDNAKDKADSADPGTTEAAVGQPAGIPPRTVEDCNYCKLYGDSLMMPPHFASPYCKSGGRNHCTCAICF